MCCPSSAHHPGSGPLAANWKEPTRSLAAPRSFNGNTGLQIGPLQRKNAKPSSYQAIKPQQSTLPSSFSSSWHRNASLQPKSMKLSHWLEWVLKFKKLQKPLKVQSHSRQMHQTPVREWWIGATVHGISSFSSKRSFRFQNLDGSVRPGGYVVSGRYLKGTFALSKAAKNTSTGPGSRAPNFNVANLSKIGSACPLCLASYGTVHDSHYIQACGGRLRSKKWTF